MIDAAKYLRCLFMTLSENIYNSLDPFERKPILASEQHLASNAKFDIRNLCLMTDLQQIYDWQNSRNRFTNFHTNENEHSALVFHSRILQSINAQSFLILKNTRPAALWTLSPAQFDPCLSKYESGVHDKSIEFLMDRDNFNYFEPLLSLIIHVCARGKHPTTLFIWLPIPLLTLSADLHRLHFSRRDHNANVFYRKMKF